MAILVNGENVPKELIEEERQRWLKAPGWDTITDPSERESLLQQSAERSAIDRVLLRQEILKDTRPIEPSLIESELARYAASNGCRTEMTANQRQSIEGNLRLQRAVQAIVKPPPHPTPDDVRAFFEANIERFRRPDEIHTAHIVKNIDQKRTEAEARAALDAATAELAQGVPFGAVADRHSDCKGNGGDLGFIARGMMVEDFEQVVFTLEPGQRSGVFKTPFGVHIAEVREKRLGRLPAFEEVAAEAEQTLVKILGERAISQGMVDLRARASIERLAESFAGA